MTQEKFDQLVFDGLILPFKDSKGNTGFIYKEDCFDPFACPKDLKINYQLRYDLEEHYEPRTQVTLK